MGTREECGGTNSESLPRHPERHDVDRLWDEWTTLTRRFICTRFSSERDPHLGHLGQLSFGSRQRGRVPTAQGVHLTDIEKCTQAVDRLKQEGPLTGLARARQIDAFQALHSQMEVQEDEFTAMLEALDPTEKHGRRDWDRPGRDWRERV